MKVRGVVSIQGSAVSPGATIMPGDAITSGPHSAASLFLGRYSMTVGPGTHVSMLANDLANGVELHSGTVVLQEPSRSPVRVQIPGAWVLVRGERQTGALCEITSLGTSSKVSLQSGFAEIHGAGAPVALHAGEWARLEVGGKAYEGQPQAGRPQADSSGSMREAGKVTREIPRGRLDRKGQTLPVNLNDPVEWDDRIQTFQSGRLQITLTDGSLLSVGSNSEMKIVRHDGQAQQTDIELAVAKMRADVQKITKSGGRFEVRTKTAVIGVVGTSFVVAADERSTLVCVMDGSVDVRSSDPAAPQTTVHVRQGESTNVPIGAPPTIPVASPRQIASLVNQTNVGTTATGAGAGSAGPSTTAIASVVTIGALGVTLGGLTASGEFRSDQPPVSPGR